MVPRDLGLVGMHEVPVADDLLAADVQAVDAMRRGEDKPRDQVPGPCQFERVRPVHREIRALAGLDGADVVPAEDGRAAARAQAQRVTRGQRRRPAARAGDEQRLLHLEEQVAPLVRRRAVDTEADGHAGVEQRAHARDAGAEAHVRRRAVRNTDASGSERAHVGVVEVDTVGTPHLVADPAELLEVLDRAAAVELAAVVVLLHRLCKVRVEPKAAPPRELCGLAHQSARHRERRARCDDDLPRIRVRETFRLGEHRVDLLDELVRRHATPRLAEIHRTARGDQRHAELGSRPQLRLYKTARPAREDVVVVENGRAAGERELGEAGACGGIDGFLVDARPHRVELAQPFEQRRLLRASARERLVQVVVRVHEAGRDDGAAEVDALLRLGRWGAADVLDAAVGDEDPAGLVLRTCVVHRREKRIA